MPEYQYLRQIHDINDSIHKSYLFAQDKKQNYGLFWKISVVLVMHKYLFLRKYMNTETNYCEEVKNIWKYLQRRSFQYTFRRIFRNIRINESFHWHFSNILAFYIYTAYLKKLLIRIPDETCLTKNSNVNFWLTFVYTVENALFLNFEYEMRSK